jgi:hypothetical protein
MFSKPIHSVPFYEVARSPRANASFARVSPNATAPSQLDRFRFGNSLMMHHFRAIDALAHEVDDETMSSRTNSRRNFDR